MEKVYENNNILFKILPCLLIAMYLVMIILGEIAYGFDNNKVTFTSKVFDFSYDLTFSNEEILSYKYICVIETGFSQYSTEYYVFLTNDDSFYVENYVENNANFFTFHSDDFAYRSATLRKAYLSDDIQKLSNFDDFTRYSLSHGSLSIQRDATEISNIFFSNTNVKDKDGNVVFQGASQELAGVTIPAIQSVEEIPQAIVKTMKIVIPVGLVVLGIGLIIYLIKSVILRMQ